VRDICKDLISGRHAQGPTEETRNKRGGNMLFGLSCKYHVPRYVCLKNSVCCITVA